MQHFRKKVTCKMFSHIFPLNKKSKYPFKNMINRHSIFEKLNFNNELKIQTWHSNSPNLNKGV